MNVMQHLEADEKVRARKRPKKTIDLTPAMTPEEIAKSVVLPDNKPSSKKWVQIPAETSLADEIESAIAETPCPKDEMEAMNLAARIMGRKGGLSRSPKKIAAVRENAKKGGRPKKAKKDLPS